MQSVNAIRHVRYSTKLCKKMAETHLSWTVLKVHYVDFNIIYSLSIGEKVFEALTCTLYLSL